MKAGPSRSLGSVYRLQLNGLGFARARSIVGYLHRLGIETLYVSPILAAVPGSTHGYDVIDPTRIDPSLGTESDFEALLAELDDHGMRLLLDIVPNHMAASPFNRWWWDVLRLGSGSPCAPLFDIDWADQAGRILLPVLGKPLGEVLADGDLAVVVEDGEPRIAYFDQRFPLAPDADPPGHGGEPAGLVGRLGAQHYRLAHWRLGRRQVNYRRFFDIDTLVGVRVEDPDTYAATHALILDLVRDDRIAGVRVDHIDGLADPAAYLRRLRDDIDRSRPNGSDRGVVLVEKIVARDERLVSDWPVDGMTGYEFADLAGGLFLDPGSGELEFDSSATEAKRQALWTLFPGQVDRLALGVATVVELERPGSDLDPADVRDAIIEITAQLRVYRTYLDGSAPSREDQRRIGDAAAHAHDRLDPESSRALGWFCQGLLAGSVGDQGDEVVGLWLAVARRWQQLTGAVAAKGVEDTALYRVDRALAAAEVGGDPADPAVSPHRFHAAIGERTRHCPATLNATTTHDTKRSEDVRSRLAALTEWSRPWEAQVDVWRDRYGAAGRPAQLGEHDELMVYQTIVGAWPRDSDDRQGFAPRIQRYALKAAREAKSRTSWSEPDPSYEDALQGFVGHLLDPGDLPFVAEVASMVEAIGPAGAVNALSLTALKMTVPGVPDVYQGTETVALSLVDPDNRMPVDFGAREATLEAIDPDGPDGEGGAERRTPPLLVSWSDGRAKLHVTHRLLSLRRSDPDLFDRAPYTPLTAHGPQQNHAVAFSRTFEDRWVVTVVPRLVVTLAGPAQLPVGSRVWNDTIVELPPGAPGVLRNVLTDTRVDASGRGLPMARSLATFPVAVLTAG
ncbi:MAG TPA: malto-oligosyltrehalose synthase [Acidimicrobiales bacterium]|nr:malto-oligosyltrehalose synthase [Acidimicrobiales bacterium]